MLPLEASLSCEGRLRPPFHEFLTQGWTDVKILASLRTIGLVVILGGGLAACSSNPLEPFQPQISNATDNFQLQATAVVGVTSTQTYSWSNTGTRATINHSTTTTTGTAQLTIRDGAGTVVYTKGLVPSLNEATATGTTGTWTIVLTMTTYSGTLNFRAQKL
jgi:hypothetical protein